MLYKETERRYYNVTEYGIVLSVSKCNGRVLKLKPGTNKAGYLYVIIDGKPKAIHRLVAELYIGDVTDMVVNHLDGDRLNNHISNLEICTQKENVRHSTLVKGNGNSKLTWKDVYDIREKYNNSTSETYATTAAKYGVNKAVIYRIVKRYTWKEK